MLFPLIHYYILGPIQGWVCARDQSMQAKHVPTDSMTTDACDRLHLFQTLLRLNVPPFYFSYVLSVLHLFRCLKPKCCSIISNDRCINISFIKKSGLWLIVHVSVEAWENWEQQRGLAQMFGQGSNARLKVISGVQVSQVTSWQTQ